MPASTRLWTAGSVVAAIVVAAGGYVLGVQPQLAHAAETDAATAAVETQISTAQTRLAALSKLAATQSEMTDQSEVLAKAVPSALQANTFSRRMNTVAAQDGVEVVSWASGEAVAYKAPTTAAPVAGASPVPVLAATDPLITSADLTVVPTTIVVEGTTDAGMQFIKDMQDDERLFLVSGYSTTVDPEDAAKVTTTLTGSIYALKS